MSLGYCEFILSAGGGWKSSEPFSLYQRKQWQSKAVGEELVKGLHRAFMEIKYSCLSK